MRPGPWTAALGALVVMVLCAGCAGPGVGPRSPAGTVSDQVMVDGVPRTFLLHRPPATTAPLPLVVMIHGGGGTAAAAEHSYGWDALADRDHFLVAYPEGEQRSWSVGAGCCGASGRAGTDDVGFITAMVAAIGRQVAVDPRRVYATGISEGGMMSYRLACQSSLFAAIGPDSATQLGLCPDPRTVSVLHIHGTADRRIPYDGRPGAGVNHITGPPIPQLISSWRARDGCAPATSTVAGVLTRSTAQCPGGRAVDLITIAGAGHQWPGGPCNARCARGTADPPSAALDATSTLWDFFAAHPG